MRYYIHHIHSNLSNTAAERYILILYDFSPLPPPLSLFVKKISIFLSEDDFLKNTNMFYKMWYLIVATMLVRFKYYYAWLFADAICNSSGLGFSGYDERGNANWDLISNVDVWKFEVQYTYLLFINE